MVIKKMLLINFNKDLSVTMTGIKTETDHQLASIGAMKKYYFLRKTL